MAYLRKWFFLALIILVMSSVYQQKMNFIETSIEKNPVNNNSETEDASVLSSPAYCFNCHTPQQMQENSINSADNIPLRLRLIHPFLEYTSIVMSIISAGVIIVGFFVALKKLVGIIPMMDIIGAAVIIAVVVLMKLEGAYLLMILLIGIAVVIICFIIEKFSPSRNSRNSVSTNRESRRYLGNSVLLGLQFLIAAEILGTIVIPSWNKLGILAATIAIRLVMARSLE